jgi:hypothetical protein
MPSSFPRCALGAVALSLSSPACAYVRATDGAAAEPPPLSLRRPATSLDSRFPTPSPTSTTSSCNTTRLVQLALDEVVDLLDSPVASSQSPRCVGGWSLLPSTADVLLSVSALARVDPVRAADAFATFLLAATAQAGGDPAPSGSSLGYLPAVARPPPSPPSSSTFAAPRPPACPSTFPPLSLVFPNATGAGGSSENQPASSSSPPLLAPPLAPTAALQIFWSLFRNTTASGAAAADVGPTAAVAFLSRVWAPLYTAHALLVGTRTFVPPAPGAATPPAAGAGVGAPDAPGGAPGVPLQLLVAARHPWESAFPSSAAWRRALDDAGEAIDAVCANASLAVAQPPTTTSLPPLLTGSPTWQGEEHFRREWCLAACLAAYPPPSSPSTSSVAGSASLAAATMITTASPCPPVAVASVLDNALAARASEHIAQIAEWLQSAAVGVVPGFTGGGGDAGVAPVTIDQAFNVQLWRAAVGRGMLTSMLFDADGGVPSSSSSSPGGGVATDDAEDDDNALWKAWFFDLTLQVGPYQGPSSSSSSSSGGGLSPSPSFPLPPAYAVASAPLVVVNGSLLSGASASALMALANPDAQGFPVPAGAGTGPFPEPDGWRTAVTSRLLAADFWGPPLIPTLPRTSANFSAGVAGLGPVWLAVNSWILDGLETSDDAGSSLAGAEAAAAFLRASARDLVCAGANGPPAALAGAYDGTTGAPLPNATAAFLPSAAAGTLLLLLPPLVPLAPPQAWRGFAALVTVLTIELIVLLGAAITCILAGARVLIERRKEAQEAQEARRGRLAAAAGGIATEDGVDDEGRYGGADDAATATEEDGEWRTRPLLSSATPVFAASSINSAANNSNAPRGGWRSDRVPARSALRTPNAAFGGPPPGSAATSASAAAFFTPDTVAHADLDARLFSSTTPAQAWSSRRGVSGTGGRGARTPKARRPSAGMGAGAEPTSSSTGAFYTPASDFGGDEQYAASPPQSLLSPSSSSHESGDAGGGSLLGTLGSGVGAVARGTWWAVSSVALAPVTIFRGVTGGGE